MRYISIFTKHLVVSCLFRIVIHILLFAKVLFIIPRIGILRMLPYPRPVEEENKRNRTTSQRNKGQQTTCPLEP